MIKNLAQLKRAIQVGTEFEIINHCRSSCIGEHRIVTFVNTLGFYSIVPEKKTLSNENLGFFLEWGKAASWSFQDNICTQYRNNSKHIDSGVLISFIIK